MNGSISDLSLQDIVDGILKSKKNIISSIIIGTICGILVATVLYIYGIAHPEFSAKVSLSINMKTAEGNYAYGSSKDSKSPGNQDIYLSVYLRDTIAYIANSNRVYEYAVKDTHLRLTYEEFQSCINVSQYKETQIMIVSVNWSDREDTLFLIEKLMDVLPDALIDTLEIGSVNAVDSTIKVVERNTEFDMFWVFVGIFVAALLSCNAAIIKVIVNPTFRSSEGVKSSLDIEILDEIKHIEFTGKLGIQTVESCSQTYLKLVYIFDNIASLKRAKSILVTSAAEGEGKSTLVSMIAAELVNKGKKVLIIDGNLRRPKIATIYGIEKNERNSLNNVLSGKISIEEGLYQYKPGLGLYTAMPETTPLINDTMGEIIDVNYNYFDYILVDSPPIGTVPDGFKISSYVDAVLFVIKQGYAPKNYIMDSLNELEKSGAAIMGCVLNDVRIQKSEKVYISGEIADGYIPASALRKNRVHIFNKIKGIFHKKEEMRKENVETEEISTEAAADPMKNPSKAEEDCHSEAAVTIDRENETAENESLHDETSESEAMSEETSERKAIHDETTDREAISDETTESELINDGTAESKAVSDAAAERELVKGGTTESESVSIETSEREAMNDDESEGDNK